MEEKKVSIESRLLFFASLLSESFVSDSPHAVRKNDHFAGAKTARDTTSIPSRLSKQILLPSVSHKKWHTVNRHIGLHARKHLRRHGISCGSETRAHFGRCFHKGHTSIQLPAASLCTQSTLSQMGSVYACGRTCLIFSTRTGHSEEGVCPFLFPSLFSVSYCS